MANDVWIANDELRIPIFWEDLNENTKKNYKEIMAKRSKHPEAWIKHWATNKHPIGFTILKKTESSDGKGD